MAIAFSLVVVFAITLPRALAAQNGARVQLRRAGPGEPGETLRAALERPYLLAYERWNTRLFRDSVYDRTVVIVGSDASVASTIHGDLIVVDGDIYLRPGARIDGRAIAYGGGVYDSEQAEVRGGRVSYWDTRYRITRTDSTIVLDYRPPPILEEAQLASLPLLYGLRIPTYTRVDGLGLPWGPRFMLTWRQGGSLQVDPTVTYRSDIGAFDPAVTAQLRLDPGWSAHLYAGRGTFTNDDWIESDLVNSIKVLLNGRDYRNYWRADRFEGRVARTLTGSSGEFTVWGGARTERDWSITAGGPWSLRGRRAGDGMIRPNPAVERGRISSALGGVGGSVSRPEIAFAAAAQVERPFDAPSDESFTQATIDAGIRFATFASQSFELHSHAVLTAGDTASPQRFSYLGGTGTLPTFPVLQFGGEQLLFIESAYNVPITPLHVPILGPPVLSLRHAIGAAGVGKLPKFEQNLIARVALGVVFAEYAIDPATRNDAFSIGLSSAMIR
ncbi:MAG TPA: hypothetical protein VFT57_01035 [Gemmatimonadaceae bacterium]|nr:hypothetical protein [Gemmatimonadaceae bacterium]